MAEQQTRTKTSGRRRGGAVSVVALAGALTVAGCGSSSSSSSGKSTGTGTGTGSAPTSTAKSAPVGSLPKGGTLKIVSQGDLGNLDTSQEYEVVGWTLDRAITRQLTSYAGDPGSLAGAGDTAPVDDLAASHTVAPTG